MELSYFRMPKNQTVEIEFLDKNAFEQKRLVHNSLNIKNNLNLVKLKPRFWSEKDVQVEQETKAKNLGFLNRERKEKSQIRKQDNSQDGVSQKLSKLGKDLFNQPESQISDFHDIQEGAITALNSERFTYYSFFERIDKRISFLWTSKLKEYQSRWTTQDIEKLGGKSWITLLELIYDQQGRYVKTIVHRSSGVGPIDMAAIESFQASQFPNPPKGMIAADGYIHLKYSFRYDVESPRRWARQ